MNGIVDFASNNPLTIKLAIDHYTITGNHIEAVAKAADAVLAYAFGRIVESLSPLEREVIEVLHQEGAVSLDELVSILAANRDEVIGSVRQLSRTSLIERDTGEDTEEEFALTEATTRLLMVSDVNDGLRSAVSEKLSTYRKQRSVAYSQAKAANHTVRSLFFITDEVIQPSERENLIEISKKIKDRKQVTEDTARSLVPELEGMAKKYPDNERVQFFLSTCYEILKAFPNAEAAMQRSVSLSRESWVYLREQAGLYFRLQNYQRMAEVGEQLLTFLPKMRLEGGVSDIGQVWRPWILGSLFVGEPARVVDRIEQEEPNAIPGEASLLAVYKASAIRRIAEDKVIEERPAIWLSAAGLINGQIGGTVDSAFYSSESMKLMKHMFMTYSGGAEIPFQSTEEILSLLKPILVQSVQEEARSAVQAVDIWTDILKLVRPGSDLATFAKAQLEEIDQIVQGQDGADEGALFGVVKSVAYQPSQNQGDKPMKKPFCFLIGEDGEDVFVSRSVFAGTRVEWEELLEGEHVLYRLGSNGKDGKARPASYMRVWDKT